MKQKTEADIALMREGGHILARVTEALRAAAKEGVTLKALDELAYALMTKAGGQPAFLGYRPTGAKHSYPASICASVNAVVVHGLPTTYRLRAGDIVAIDLGLLYKGFYTDTAITVGIGSISAAAKKLIDVTREALALGIAECHMGKTLGDIGHAINQHATQNGFKVLKGLTGHSIGKKLHEDPLVYNEGRPGAGSPLVSGMVLAIEPMISAGSPHLKQLPDESYATIDNALSAHFEHTVAITEHGPEILTAI